MDCNKHITLRFVVKFCAFLACFAVVAVFAILLSQMLGINGSFMLNSHIPIISEISPDKRVCFVIDAGHGGEDGGAVSDGGICEKDINLDISLKLFDMLKLSDFKTVLTRSEDKLLYNSGEESRKKYHDINNRIKIVNECENPVLVSVHQNKFPIKKYSGFQVYCSGNNPESVNFGNLMQNNVKEYLQPYNKRQPKLADKTIRLLNSLHVPAVLAECGFLSNDAEAQMLATNEYKNKMAYVLYVSAVQFAKEYEGTTIENKN